MGLCSTCTEIPWRTPRGESIVEQAHLNAFARLRSTAGDRFQWCDGSGRPVTSNKEFWPFIRNDDPTCQFCQLVTHVVRDPGVLPTYHGGFKLKKKNFYGEAWKEKAIWTQLLGRKDDRPIVRLWIGETRPEHFIRTIEPQTTFGKTEQI